MTQAVRNARARRVLLTDHPWPDLELERSVFRNAGLDLVAGPVEASSASQVEALARECDPAAIMTCWATISEAAVAAATDLKIVARLGVGLDNIAVSAATARGAWVTNVPDYCVEEVSTHAVALLLAHFRGIVALDREAKLLGWRPDSASLRRVSQLTVGVLGFGRIGRATARRLADLGCRVLVFDRAPAVDFPGAEPAGLEVIQEQADAVVLHLPLTDETRKIVDDAFIRGCRRKPLLVNVSRSGLIDHAALLRGLDAGLLGGAALDVVDGEPAPSAEILTRPDIIVTPHVAFLSDASLIELRRRACEEVVRVLRGELPHHGCNAPLSGDPRDPRFDGGVASELRAAEAPEGSVVIKRALGKLRVAAEWFSDPARSLVEAAALKAIGELIGAPHVPRVLWTDPERHEFAMELIPSRLRNWKRDLMDGTIDLETASTVGRLLGRMHAASSGRRDLEQRFAEKRFFRELRIVPYLQSIAERNPDLASAIDQAAAVLLARHEALVHGDFSPKNILARGTEVVFLDCEVAHWGDPRFDLAFILHHLLLKADRKGAPRAALIEAAGRVLEGYASTGPAVIDADLARLVGCLTLARLEGDSPVDYLADLDLNHVKRRARRLILRPPALLPGARTTLEELS
ncbi:NAD(P)-dependent oxidoreductase [Bradyrhizobium sp. Pha-3]|uniref:NAD(P)-dependent oxidoreductase n=1 Tax=Bradyrhizobium sp. Pha-3 TaxID=208375 RepID=UPI0035D4C5BE